MARANLEKEIQPRTIGEDDRKEIANKLRGFAPTFNGRQVKVASQTGDAEGMLFALEILDILQRAKIPVDTTGMGSVVWVHAVAMGVTMTGPSGDEKFLRFLAHELNSKLDPLLGTSVGGEWKPDQKELQIMVGSKPIPGLPKEFLRQRP